MVKIIGISGSLRADSLNTQILKIAANSAEQAGAEVEIVDLKALELPIYDGDYENKNGIPETAQGLKLKMSESNGILIASPEYNSSYSAALKNAIDWVSRPAKDEAPLMAFNGKVAGLLSASPGQLGGLRGLLNLRQLLGNIKMFVIPEQYAANVRSDSFNQDGDLIDQKQHSAVQKVGESLVKYAGLLNN